MCYAYMAIKFVYEWKDKIIKGTGGKRRFKNGNEWKKVEVVQLIVL